MIIVLTTRKGKPLITLVSADMAVRTATKMNYARKHYLQVRVNETGC